MFRGWRVYESDAREKERGERPRGILTDSAKDVLHIRGLNIQRGRECTHDRSE